MIVGLGLDVAEIHRIEKAIERHGDAFKRRVYTAAEQADCERSAKLAPRARKLKDRKVAADIKGTEKKRSKGLKKGTVNA